MSTPPTIPPTSPPPFGNASTLLTIMGILLILGGLGCGGGTIAYTVAMPMLLNSSLYTGTAGGPATTTAETFEAMRPMMVLSSILYCGFGLGIAWLGIGSIRARRWSWKLLVALGWLWVGLVGLGAVSYGFTLPQMMEGMKAGLPRSTGGPSGSFFVIMMIIGVIFGSMIYVTPGVALIVVYRLRDVRLTCEWRDPAPRWTDPVPLPILVLWLLLTVSFFSIATFAPMYLGLIKIPGMATLSPMVGRIGWLTALVLIGFATRDVAAMRLRGWWLSLSTVIFGTAVAVWTALHYDVMQMYREMKMPEETLRQMEKMLNGMSYWIPALITGLAMIGYLLWLKRFFAQENQNETSVAG